MTAAEWLGSTDPDAMLKTVKGRRNERKLRLFAVACCRRGGRLWTDEQSAKALELAERYADGQAAKAQRRNAQAALVGAAFRGTAVASTLDKVAFAAAHRAAWYTARAIARNDERCDLRPGRSIAGQVPYREERSAQAELLREIFGNPLCPVVFSSDWRTGTALALARQMYEAREFGAMPILADALQDAGCADETVLSHCRGPGPHVRGCWVIDELLVQKDERRP